MSGILTPNLHFFLYQFTQVFWKTTMKEGKRISPVSRHLNQQAVGAGLNQAVKQQMLKPRSLQSQKIQNQVSSRQRTRYGEAKTAETT